MLVLQQARQVIDREARAARLLLSVHYMQGPVDLKKKASIGEFAGDDVDVGPVERDAQLIGRGTGRSDGVLVAVEHEVALEGGEGEGCGGNLALF